MPQIDCKFKLAGKDIYLNKRQRLSTINDKKLKIWSTNTIRQCRSPLNSRYVKLKWRHL